MTYIDRFDNIGGIDNIEAGLATDSDSVSTTNYKNMDGFGSCCRTFCAKFGFWLIGMIIGFPIPFCDLYYGYMDDTCVSEQAGKLAINLEDYLLVCGWIELCILGLLSIALCFIDIGLSGSGSADNNGCFVCGGALFGIIFALSSIFIGIWNIFGAIIFWGLMDTSNCSSSIYNYVFASLIIKLVLNAIGILQTKNDNKK